MHKFNKKINKNGCRLSCGHNNAFEHAQHLNERTDRLNYMNGCCDKSEINPLEEARLAGNLRSQTVVYSYVCVCVCIPVYSLFVFCMTEFLSVLLHIMHLLLLLLH